MIRWRPGCAPALALAGLLLCGCSDGDGHLHRNSGDNPFGRDVVRPSGSALVDALLDASARCGFQSPNTVPASWKRVLVGSSGCALSVPSAWLPRGASTHLLRVDESAAVLASVFAMTEFPAGSATPCTPAGVAGFVKNTWGAGGCTGMQEIYYRERRTLLAGREVPAADLFVTCAVAGLPTLASARIAVTDTRPQCDPLATGFWVARDRIPDKTCTLTQATQSYACPSGGSYCAGPDCETDCVKAGYGGGACDARDRCVCR
jgi:hypothetical protein